MAATVMSQQQSVQPTGNAFSSSQLRNDPYETWKQDIQNYQEQRTTFKGFAEPYVKKTHKEIKMKETSYNPIT